MENHFHVWFSPKNRKWLLQGEITELALSLIKDVATKDGHNILAIEAMPDHVHLLLKLKDGRSISKCVKDLKGASAYGILRAIPELKLDAHTNNFWQKSFGKRAVPIDQVKIVARYIQTQHDRMEKYIK